MMIHTNIDIRYRNIQIFNAPCPTVFFSVMLCCDGYCHPCLLMIPQIDNLCLEVLICMLRKSCLFRARVFPSYLYYVAYLMSFAMTRFGPRIEHNPDATTNVCAKFYATVTGFILVQLININISWDENNYSILA